MGLLNLILRIGYDGSQASRGLDSLDKKVQEQSTRMMARVKANFIKGAAIGVGATLISKIFGDARELQEMASANDVTMAQMSRLIKLANDAGMSFESYRKEVEKTGESLQKFSSRQAVGIKDVLDQELSKGINKSLGAIKNMAGYIKYLTPAGMAAIWRLNSEGPSEELHSALPLPADTLAKRKAAEKRGALDTSNPDFMSRRGRDFETEHQAFLSSRSSISPAVNSLQQVGLMGVAQNETVTLQREAIQVLRHIDGTLERIKEDARLDPNKVDFAR